MLTQCDGTKNTMIEVQNKQAQLWLGDRTFRQLALKVWKLGAVALKQVDEAVKKAHGVHEFLQALPPS